MLRGRRVGANGSQRLRLRELGSYGSVSPLSDIVFDAKGLVSFRVIVNRYVLVLQERSRFSASTRKGETVGIPGPEKV